MPRPLARVISRAPHSRTCATLPAADSRSGRNTVWIESMTSARGFTSSRCASTTDRSFSGQSKSPSVAMPSRSARIFTCTADSSAVTYRTGGAACASARAAWRSNVLLPTPGSPPINTSEPRTTPPPSTRSSSPIPVRTRSSGSIEISFRARGRAEATPARRDERDATGRSSTSCTQLLPARRQSGHVPGLGLENPHSWQR